MALDTQPVDLSGVTDPAARAMLEHMAAMVQQLRASIEPLQATIAQLTATIEQLRQENAELKRLLFGKKSERMPRIADELRRRRTKDGVDPDASRKQAKAKDKRKRTAQAKKELPTEDVLHEVRPEQEVCPHCGGTRFVDLGQGEVTYEYEWVPGHLVRRRHTQRKKACRCGAHVITAPGPVRVTEGTQYGPGLHAQVVVAKLCDSLPLYRQAKQMQRVGLPASRSTLCDLFHRSAHKLSPLHQRMLELVRDDPYVNADETPIQVLAPGTGKTRRAYIWTFISAQVVAYVYSPSRSGQTPVQVLGGSTGFLQVDAYSGYNAVCVPDGRTRVGCMAHARRYMYRALEVAPVEARWMLDRIADLYAVEYAAAVRGILGSKKHLALRKLCSAPVMDEVLLYVEQDKDQHLPKGPMGQALTYLDNNKESLEHFLTDPKLSLDNNISEGQLRIMALGRKNFLFLGNDVAGEHLAVLQSLASSCQLHGVNPLEYFKDVLIRVAGGHPQSRLDELLPHNWSPATDSS